LIHRLYPLPIGRSGIFGPRLPVRRFAWGREEQACWKQIEQARQLQGPLLFAVGVRVSKYAPSGRRSGVGRFLEAVSFAASQPGVRFQFLVIVRLRARRRAGRQPRRRMVPVSECRAWTSPTSEYVSVSNARGRTQREGKVGTSARMGKLSDGGRASGYPVGPDPGDPNRFRRARIIRDDGFRQRHEAGRDRGRRRDRRKNARRLLGGSKVLAAFAR